MPTYEYRCRECKKQFERVEALSEHGHGRLQCPQCKSRQVEQVLTPFFAKTARKA
jgi:putative FmdB family regulatory protein